MTSLTHAHSNTPAVITSTSGLNTPRDYCLSPGLDCQSSLGFNLSRSNTPLSLYPPDSLDITEFWNAAENPDGISMDDLFVSPAVCEDNTLESPTKAFVATTEEDEQLPVHESLLGNHTDDNE